jgi:PrcB C-terminal
MTRSGTFQVVSFLVILLVCLSPAIGRIQSSNSSSRIVTSDKSSAPTNQDHPLIGEMKVLLEGSQSTIQEPFVAVCRESETYLALKKIDGNLPKLEANFFQSHLVLAAYLGTRNTGGYRVEIERKGDPDNNLPSPDRTRFQITEKGPPKGAMVTQVITSPFVIVSLEVNGTPPLILSLDYAWRQRQQLYRIKSGSFQVGGGLAGISEALEAHGELLILRTNGLASFYISISGTGGSKPRSLSDFATAIVDKESVAIKKFTADYFVDGPNGGFTATGTWKERDGKLTLQLASGRSIVSDGYSGGGSLDAELVQPAMKP